MNFVALFGTITTTALGKKLVGLNYLKLQKEADFRYSLVRVRDNAESIAFYAGEDIENKEVVKRLEKVIDNRRDINVAQRNVEFFTTSYNCESCDYSIFSPVNFVYVLSSHNWTRANSRTCSFAIKI